MQYAYLIPIVTVIRNAMVRAKSPQFWVEDDDPAARTRRRERTTMYTVHADNTIMVNALIKLVENMANSLHRIVRKTCSLSIERDAPWAALNKTEKRTANDTTTFLRSDL